MSRLSSQAPATLAPSGVVLDTPVLDAPDNGGYTNQTPVPIQGGVPGAALGKTGYSVIVYRTDKAGTRQQVAQVSVGTTTQFITPPIALTEGSNVFMATLDTPGGEGQPSPPVTYILDTTPPTITVTSPAQNAWFRVASVAVTGQTDPGITITIRNEQVTGGAQTNQTVGADGKFNLTVPLVAGSNTIDLTATDQAGNGSNSSLTVNRTYGQLAAHLSASPAKFSSSSPTLVTLTVHATSANGGPLANAKVTFTITIYGLGPIVSPELTTDATGTATWQVSISWSARPWAGERRRDVAGGRCRPRHGIDHDHLSPRRGTRRRRDRAAGPGPSRQLQSRHGQLALPALWIAAARNGAVLGLPSLHDLVRDLPPLPQGRYRPARLLRPGQASQPADRRRGARLLGATGIRNGRGCPFRRRAPGRRPRPVGRGPTAADDRGSDDPGHGDVDRVRARGRAADRPHTRTKVLFDPGRGAAFPGTNGPPAGSRDYAGSGGPAGGWPRRPPGFG